MTRAQPYDRETALKAAMLLFWQKGYHATSLKDLEAALKMKPGSIYSAFGSKEGLFLETLDFYMVNARSMFSDAVETSGSPLNVLKDQLIAFAEQPDSPLQPQVCMIIKTLIDTKSTDTKIADQARNHLSSMGVFFAKLFTQAIEKGELSKDADPVKLAQRYLSSINAIRLERHLGLSTNQAGQMAQGTIKAIDAFRL